MFKLSSLLALSSLGFAMIHYFWHWLMTAYHWSCDDLLSFIMEMTEFNIVIVPVKQMGRSREREVVSNSIYRLIENGLY